eukprot:TRINITY_DN4319_c0_g2_i1.p1 TRINITY_DN4319_c0_g2~~TRINITY_DN4319_c0_g2_i1.p1  ORF type:complete len:256 (-),score=34.07 TRINITY_DN4319_c0_g2_i1:196-927(-)
MAAEAGLCLGEIGTMMSRGFHEMEEEPSELEVICLEAKIEAHQAFSVSANVAHTISFEPHNSLKGYVAKNLQFHTDCKEYSTESQTAGNGCKRLSPSSSEKKTQRTSPSKSMNMRRFYDTFSTIYHEHLNLVSEREASQAPEESEIQGADTASSEANSLHRSLKEANVSFLQRDSNMKTFSTQGLSTEEQSAITANHIGFSDLTDEEWVIFIHYFQKLLPEAFTSRKAMNLSLRQRLGTSCRF